jgi:dihydrolipoamide dehydrogenase
MHDVAVIGGGSGGYAAAIRAAQLGAKVVLIEAGDMGGTCVNRGCVPSKIWLHAVNLHQRAQNAGEFGVNLTLGETNYPAIVERKNGVAGEIRMGMEALLQNNGVEIVPGRAVVTGPGKIEADGRELEAKNIIIAVGSRLEAPEVAGLDKAAVTTDEVLDMEQPPRSILICGSGYIEVEMAHLLSAFGVQVTMAAESERILPKEDSETSQRMAQALRAQGVEILAGSSLASVEMTKNGAFCQIKGGLEQELSADKILVSRRVPNTAGLGLDALGLKLNPDQGVWVDEYLQTSQEGVYAIGDAAGGWMLSHAASSMAVFAAENAMGQARKYPFNLIPRCLWTNPQMASVGLSEDEAEEQGFEVETGSFPYSINGMAMAYNQVDGAVKIVSDERYGEILGVHIVGSNATEVIGEAVLAMQLEATAPELARGIRVHPTFSEAMVDAARDVGGWALYLPRG